MIALSTRSLFAPRRLARIVASGLAALATISLLVPMAAAVEPEPAHDSDDEPWRPAIHLPLADAYQPPEGYFIKAYTHSGLYYTPESVLYDNTVPEVSFASEEVAQANGFVRAPE